METTAVEREYADRRPSTSAGATRELGIAKSRLHPHGAVLVEGGRDVGAAAPVAVFQLASSMSLIDHVAPR